MLTIVGRNVNDLYAKARRLIRQVGVTSTSRNGDVLVAPYPVMSVYLNPCERVLWDPARDANPFFHLCEAIWMLAGRDDAAFLNRFVRDFGDRFAEPGGRLHGAYGARWRHHWDLDQLRVTVERLRRDWSDRRVVIAMWDPVHDLWSKDEWDFEDKAAAEHFNRTEPVSTYSEPKDLPCNTHIYPRIVDGQLDLTVCCRSNDIVWGAYGANAVHFSVLQEYLAAAIGVQVGKMYQLSNNWHGYVPVLDKTEPQYEVIDLYTGVSPHLNAVQPTPMVTHPNSFLNNCEVFCESPLAGRIYENHWFTQTAVPMARVAAAWRDGERTTAAGLLGEIGAADWRLAAQQWIARRAVR